MPSATAFLPSSITLFMNLDRTISPNLGSGRISRFSGRRRRAILNFLLKLQRTRNTSGAYFGCLFGTLGAVLRTRLLAVLDALGVEHAAQHVIADARQVAHAVDTYHHHRELLQVVP